MQTVDGSKKDQREYHACGVGKNADLLPVELSKGATASEAKVVGGATVERIK